MTDNGKNGPKECLQMQTIVNNLGSTTRILVASIRDTQTIANLAVEGNLDTYTFSPDVARQLFGVPLTDVAAREFEEAAERGGGGGALVESGFPIL